MQFSIDLAHRPTARATDIPGGPCRVTAGELCISFAVFLDVTPALRPSLNYYYKSKHAPSESLF